MHGKTLPWWDFIELRAGAALFVLICPVLGLVCSSQLMCVRPYVGMCTRAHRHTDTWCALTLILGSCECSPKGSQPHCTYTRISLHFTTSCLSLDVTHVPFKRDIPYGTGGDIRVTSSHLPNHGVQSSIFMNFEEVSR